MNDLILKTAATDLLASQQQTTQHLTFLLGQETFAIRIVDVKEIIEITHVTRVPMTPDFIHGVINLRGHVVPVIDLSARLGFGCTEVNKRSCIILVEVEAAKNTQLLGLLVDEVREILDISVENIQSAPDFGTEIRTEFIQAMGRVGDDFIILLAISRVLSLQELAQLQQLPLDQENVANKKED